MLERWLEFHRTTLLLKCEGMDDASRKDRPVATSELSLHGLIRHMAEDERNWFRGVLAGDADAPYIFGDFEGAEMVPLDDANWDDDLRIWQLLHPFVPGIFAKSSHGPAAQCSRASVA